MQCALCQKDVPESDLIQLQGMQICGDCKATAVSRLTEGVAIDSAQAERETVIAVAKNQKGILWCIFAAICFLGLNFAVGLNRDTLMAVAGVLLIGRLALLCVQMFFVYRLATALKAAVPVLWALAMVLSLLLGIVGLVILLVLNSSATSYLREHGVRVGLMGAKLSDIPA